MGQKTNPIGLRIAVTRDWRSKWYAGKKEFGKLLTEDRQIRELLKKKLESASVPQILIERAASRCRITILTARPGIVIGLKGAEIDKLKEELSKMTGKEIYVDIVEIKTPETDAQLVAENVALHTLRADIDYGFAEANTVYGKLGIKCWICKGEMKVPKILPPVETMASN